MALPPFGLAVRHSRTMSPNVRAQAKTPNFPRVVLRALNMGLKQLADLVRKRSVPAEKGAFSEMGPAVFTHLVPEPVANRHGEHLLLAVGKVRADQQLRDLV